VRSARLGSARVKRLELVHEAARLLAERGCDVLVVGGPAKRAGAGIVATAAARFRALTGTDLRTAFCHGGGRRPPFPTTQG